MAENTIEKLEKELNCAICLDTFTDPKLLQCFHVYCRDCLVKLVVRDQQGQLSLTCPTCRQATPIPANGVTGLQSAFRVNHLLEILEEHKKAKDTATSQEGAKSVVTHPIPSRKVITNCFEHQDKERELYCETCEDLICIKCAIKGGKHHDHDHYVLDEAFERYKGEVTPSLELMEGKLVAVKEALALLDKRCGEISDHQQAVETEIHDTVGRLHETLNVRKTELISKLHKITQRKLKDLAVQRDQMETILAQLSSSLNFVGESLKTSSQGEVLMMKTNIVNQVKELTSPFQSDSLKPNTEADMKFVPSQDMTSRCQNYGRIFSAKSPDPSKFQTTGKGLKVAVVGGKSTAVMKAINHEGEPCMASIHSLQCELVSEITGATERGNFEHKGQNLYLISYQPTIKGKHQLCIKVKDTHIRGSPFVVTVTLPVEKLGTPILTIDGVEEPCAVVNQRGEVVVTERGKHCISIFSPSGEKLRSFGIQGSGQGQFESPHGVAVDGAGNILVADTDNHRIQKFTANGQFLSEVSMQGKEVDAPMNIAFNARNDKVYVVDYKNRLVQILNSDLSSSSTFELRLELGQKLGIELGLRLFGLLNISSIACDSTGRVYTVDTKSDIEVFTAKGQFLRTFGFELDFSCRGIAIDSNDNVYVSDYHNHCIRVFTSDGRLVTLFGREGSGPGEFNFPEGVTVDSSGVVYVCDRQNNRIQVF